EVSYVAHTNATRTHVVRALRELGAKRVMLHDAGYLAWSGAAPVFIDMVGLKSPEAAELHSQLTGPTCGSKRPLAITSLAAATAPDALVIWEPWDDVFEVTSALRAAGWTLEPRATVGDSAPIVV